MKRIVTAILFTITTLVLLFGYHTSTSGPLATGSETSVISGAEQPVTGTSGTTTTPSTTTPSSSEATPVPSITNAAPSDSGSSSSAATSFTGAVAQTRWGPVQVQVSVAGGKVSDVSVVQYPSGNGKDQEINSYALPILIDETKQAQSADIDMVSGATVTSQGYLQSLQSALDEANL